MKITNINREALLQPLEAVVGIVERRSTLPIYANVLVEHADGALRFTATDREIQISTAATVEGDLIAERESFTASAHKLLEIVRALPNGAATSVETVQTRLRVSAGRDRFNLQTLPADQFLKMAAAECSDPIMLTQKSLRHVIKMAQCAMAQADVRAYLNGMLIVADVDKICAVSTDGHRLAYAEHASAARDKRKEAIVPRKALLELVKLLKDDDTPVVVEIADRQARFAMGATEVISKVIDARFPDYQRVMPKYDANSRFTVDRASLLGSLQRAAILSNEKLRSVKLDVKADRLSIACANADAEDASTELDIIFRGQPAEIGFNVAYLIDALASAEDVGNVEVGIGGSGGSALMTFHDHPGVAHVIMPMRI